MSNASEREEDSEDTASRTGSHTDSHTDLRTDTVDSTTQPLEPVYDKPWGNPSPGTIRHGSSSSPHSTGKTHKFVVKSFQSPYKCNFCNSLLVGLQRQGINCEGWSCAFEILGDLCFW